jgi:hypothetical protein
LDQVARNPDLNIVAANQWCTKVGTRTAPWFLKLLEKTLFRREVSMS